MTHLVAQLIFLLVGSTSTSFASRTLSTYDYIVVGGGTSGLVVASRLSENPNVTVAVIEAGESQFNNPNVKNTTTFGLSLNTSIDWQYESAPQPYAGNKKLFYNAGKGLGGSSLVNGMTYVRPEDVQIDVWEQLGNKGLNWASLFPYFKKSEGFVPPDATRLAKGATYDPVNHGFQGPVSVGWQSTMMGDGAAQLFNSTWQNLSIPWNNDFNSGKLRGYSVWPFTLDANTDTRDDSARAYIFSGASDRKNLHLYVNTLANRLVWQDSKDACASGVEVTTSTGEVQTISANKEVIVSLGAHRTPAFLEHSGVGNPEILKKFNIPVKVDLPRVGENLQDQPQHVVVNSALKNYTGYSAYITFPNVHDLFGDQASSEQESVKQNLPNYAAKIAAESLNTTTAAIQLQLLQTQFDLIFSKNLPLAEILNVPGLGIHYGPLWGLIPFSRGSTHIVSSNFSVYPAINPNMFQIDWDMKVLIETNRLWRKALATEPAKSITGPELIPGFETVPADASDEVWATFLRKAFQTNNHPVGTAAMMSRELGGVVDSSNKVYGTQNVRVVDASVFPFQVCGHLTSTLYAMAERAVDQIKNSGKHRYGE